jgi:SAM-dependent methyltransferase
MRPITEAPNPALYAYELTAEHYDEFTAHHDYELWLGNLVPALEKLGLHGDRLLDLACGTGKSFLPLLERGWNVVAVDVSPAMLARARAKAPPQTPLYALDMRALPKLGEFDLVWCLDDALNYLLSQGDLERALKGVARNLAVDGLALFDLSTLATYRTFFAERHEVELSTGRLVWQGHGSAQVASGSEVEASLEAEDASGYTVWRAVHRQRHYRVEQVRRAVGLAGLEVKAVYGHGHDARLEQPLDETRHAKAIFVVGHGERR